VQGVTPASNPNPNLRWERKEEINAGLDFSLFKSRVSGAIDYYQRTTSNLLYTYNVPVPPNLYNTIFDNVGDIKNSGIEVALNTLPVKSKIVDWNLGATFSANKNNVEKFSSNKYQLDFINAGFTGPLIQQSTHRLEEGQPVGNFFGLQSVGLDERGNWIVLNAEGQEISIAEAGEGDKRVLGNGIPKVFASLFTSVRYKNFDLGVTIRGAFKYDILNQYRMQFESLGRIAETNVPVTVLEKPYGGEQFIRAAPNYVSYFIEKGDFVKIDNASLGFRIPIKNRTIIKNARIYVSGLNLYTFSKYKGVDPEVSFKGLDPGMDYYEKYPPIRTFTFGLNVSL
jgi:hypothetical protein